MPIDTDTTFSAKGDDVFDSPGWWIAGGVAMLVWTGLVLLLTNA